MSWKTRPFVILSMALMMFESAATSAQLDKAAILNCVVTGDIEISPTAFQNTLCEKAADVLRAQLVNEKQFDAAINSAGPNMMWKLHAHINGNVSISYSLERAAGNDWKRGQVDKTPTLSVDVMDADLFDIVLDKLERDLNLLRTQFG